MTEKRTQQTQFQVTDKRFWVQDENIIERSAETESRLPTYVEELQHRTEVAEQKLKQRLDELESENRAFKARLDQQLQRRLEQEKGELLQTFLEVVDNLERALQASSDEADPESLKEGLKMNLDLFLDKLRSLGLEIVEVQNRPFDPRIAEAIGVLEVADPGLDDHVVEVVQRGYRLKDQLVRPAIVKVGRFRKG